MAGNNPAFSVGQSELVIALEAVRGTAAASPAAMPYKSPKYKPNLSLAPDQTLQGSMALTYDLVRSLRYDGHGWDSYVYLDTFSTIVAATLGSTDGVTAAPANTTLAASAVAGATTVSTTATIAAGSYIAIGSGSTLETHKTTAVSGAGPFTVTLAVPLIYAQANAAAVTGLTQHKWSLLNNSASTGNQPPSCTITDYDGDQWRQITAAQIIKTAIKGNATGLVDYSVEWAGNAATTPSAPTYTPTTTQAPPGWNVAVSIGGTALNYVESWELNLNRGTTPIPAITGTQAYFNYWADQLEATGKLTVIEQSGAPQITQYLAGTKQALDLTFFDLSTGYACNMHGTTCMFKTAELQRGAKGQVKAALDFELLPNATDATAGGKSHMAVVIANATTTAYVGS